VLLEVVWLVLQPVCEDNRRAIYVADVSCIGNPGAKPSQALAFTAPVAMNGRIGRHFWLLKGIIRQLVCRVRAAIAFTELRK
jgi:hypothetical protein